MHGLSIYIAGDEGLARQLVARFCYQQGACFTVTPTTYVYTGGQEAGVIVGLIEYPRFPSTSEARWDRATRLARLLVEGLCQKSCTVTDGERSEFIQVAPPGARAS